MCVDVGRVKCWGRNVNGQLGNGEVGPASAIPVDVVGLSSGVAQINAGFEHTCAVTAEGGAWCWGDNRSAQLGIGLPNPAIPNSPTPIAPLFMSAGVAQIAAGGSHTCVAMTSGTAECWGAGFHGQGGWSLGPTLVGAAFLAGDLTSGVVGSRQVSNTRAR